MKPLKCRSWSGRHQKLTPPAIVTSLLYPAVFALWQRIWPGAETVRVFKLPKPSRNCHFKTALCLAVMLCVPLKAVSAAGAGTVVAWGDNEFGQTNVPPGLTNVLAVAVGSLHVLALKSDGTVVAWGSNASGLTNVPSASSSVTAVAAGYGHSLALKSDATVVAWGWNNYGQTDVPSGLSNVVAVAGGYGHSLALKSNGVVVAWGLNSDNQIDVPSGLSNVLAIAAGGYNSGAIRRNGTVVEWGDNDYHQNNVPAGLSNVVALVVGRPSLALKANGTLVAWGGYSADETNVPAGASNIVAIGNSGRMALKSDGTVVAWGSNAYGLTNVPAGIGPVASIAASGNVNLALLGGPVNILAGPDGHSAPTGYDTDFQVKVLGFQPLAYRWFFNETNLLAGATNAVLHLANVQHPRSGNYQVVVTNAFAGVTSSPAILNVSDAPFVMGSPTNRNAFVGDAVNFSVVAVGAQPLACQWFFGSEAILGATNATLQLTNVQLSQEGFYSAVITNVYGVATSSPARLDVFSPVVRVASETALRAALDHTNTVTFAFDGTIVLSNTISVKTNAVLDGGGHQIVISGSKSVCVFYVNSNVSLTLLNLTVADGLNTNVGFGGGIFNVGTLTAVDCIFSNNSTIGSAGAYNSGNPGTNGFGGAIYNGGFLNADRCMFVSNSVVGGDGGACYLVGGPGVGPGGAGGNGRGGAIGNLGTLTMTGCLLANNSATGGRGGVGGGGYYDSKGGLGGKGGDGNGGALFNNGSAILVNTTFALNLGAGGMGGDGGQGGPASSQSSYTGDGGDGGNGGSGYGAIYAVSGQCYLTNCTIALNPTIRGNGGGGGPPGYWNYPYPYPPRLGHYGASGTNGLAGSALDTAGATLFNILLSGNTPTNCIGAIADAGHNLSSDGSCVFGGTGSMSNTDPKLGPLADNGGPTLTMALLPGSPAIDAGGAVGAPATDQRGVPRPQGSGVDIGAYEYLVSPIFMGTTMLNATNRQVRLCGLTPNPTLTLQASTNLASWWDVTNLTAGANGVFQCVDPIPGDAQARFYRLKSGAPQE